MILKLISDYVKGIRNSLKRGKIKDALDKLEEFIYLTKDNELDSEYLLISAQYNDYINNKSLGIDAKDEIKNRIIKSLITLLNNTREIAVENATIDTGIQLEEITQRTAHVLENLEKINQVLAESRLLEMELALVRFGFQFDEDETIRMENQIAKLRELIK